MINKTTGRNIGKPEGGRVFVWEGKGEGVCETCWKNLLFFATKTQKWFLFAICTPFVPHLFAFSENGFEWEPDRSRGGVKQKGWVRSTTTTTPKRTTEESGSEARRWGPLPISTRGEKSGILKARHSGAVPRRCRLKSVVGDAERARLAPVAASGAGAGVGVWGLGDGAGGPGGGGEGGVAGAAEGGGGGPGWAAGCRGALRCGMK